MKIKESYNPVGKHDYLSMQHLERYRFALQYLKPGMRVLDIACGTGYGTAMFKQAGCEVIGGDYDEETVTTAKNEWKGITFEYANALDLPFQDAEFDAVISFETIEHVYDGELFLSEMRRVLKPGGVFICSTPNIRYTSHPPYHVCEYTPDNFFTLIRKHFSEVELWGQYFKPVDRLRDMFNWHVLPRLTLPLISFLEVLGLKSFIKQLLQSSSLDRQGNRQINQNVELNNNVMEDCQYCVKPIGSESLLRIMLIVGRKPI